DTYTLTSIFYSINSSDVDSSPTRRSSDLKLVLTGTTSSEDLITVASDTTGLLNAAHLDTNNTIRGHLPEDRVAFYNLSRFSSVTNGSFVADEKTINVSTSDTIQSIISKIN